MTEKNVKNCDYAIVKYQEDGTHSEVCFKITKDMYEYCDKFRTLPLTDEKMEKFKALLDHLLLSLNE